MDRRSLLVRGTAAAAAVSGVLRWTPNASSAPGYVWSHPLVNGGMANVAQAHPSREGEFMLGGDLWGWYRTRDAMLTWQGTMRGLSGIGAIYGRACRYSLADPDTCYIAVGVLKSTGGYFGVVYGNATTRRRGPQYGANLGSGAGGGLPRPVGNLIDVTMAGGVERIVTAAYNGIQYSTDKGQSWHMLRSSSQNWKAIAALDETTCLAARYATSGLTLVKGSTVTNPSAPGVINDLRTIAGTIWGGGPNNLYRWNGAQLAKHPTTFFTNHKVTSIDGSADGQVLLVGVDDPNSAALSTDGGQSWRWLKAGNDGKTMDGRPYWLAAAATNGWGQSRFSASQVAVDKANPQNLFVAGRGGAWGSHDMGASWHAAAPAGNEVSHLRAGPGGDEFAGDDNDWTGWHTTDTFGHTTAKQAQTSLHGGLTLSSGGHTFKVSPGSITCDGVSVADDVFRGGCVNPTAIARSPSGKLLVGQYGGSLLLGTPLG